MGDISDSIAGDVSEGEKLQVVRNTLNNAVSKVLGGWRSSLLASCFPSLSKDNKNVIDAMRASMAMAVQKALLEDFAMIVDEDVTKSLNEFNTIIKSCSGPKDSIAWRPPRDPQIHMLAHDAKVLQYEKEHILEALKRVKASSGRAQEAVDRENKECQKRHLEIERNMSVINDLLETSETINDALIKDLGQAVLSSPTKSNTED